jgi:hypothetical protein
MRKMTKGQAERLLLEDCNRHLAPGQPPYDMNYIQYQIFHDRGDHWLVRHPGTDYVCLIADHGIYAYFTRFRTDEDALAEFRALAEESDGNPRSWVRLSPP